MDAATTMPASLERVAIVPSGFVSGPLPALMKTGRGAQSAISS